MRLSQGDLDSLFLKNKISSEEYYNLSTEEVSTIVTAIDKIDNMTTLSITKEAGSYSGEVVYPPQYTNLDEKFVKGESSLKQACSTFLDKVKALEKRGHEFDVTWFVRKPKDI